MAVSILYVTLFPHVRKKNCCPVDAYPMKLKGWGGMGLTLDAIGTGCSPTKEENGSNRRTMTKAISPRSRTNPMAGSDVVQGTGQPSIVQPPPRSQVESESITHTLRHAAGRQTWGAGFRSLAPPSPSPHSIALAAGSRKSPVGYRCDLRHG